MVIEKTVGIQPGTARSSRKWMTPDREGQSAGRKGRRFCRRCGTSVKQVRIMSALNLCERCAKELSSIKEGKWACKGCGKIAPSQLERHNGYCKDCICPACKQPSPASVRRTGLCEVCLASASMVCRGCGKEASSQVKRNKGYCDACAQSKQRG